jgi:molecular chaperone GrpE
MTQTKGQQEKSSLETESPIVEEQSELVNNTGGAPEGASIATGEANDPWEQKYRDVYDQYVRLAADFDNFRKRYAQEQEALRKYGSERALYELIPVLDNLERAAGSLSENTDPKMLYQSFRLVQNQLLEALGGLGLKKIDSLGKPFDPSYHEAVAQVPSDEHPDQTVVREQQSGFMYHDRVLRPALVAVAVPSPESNGPSEQKESGDANNPFKHSTAPGGSYTP